MKEANMPEKLTHNPEQESGGKHEKPELQVEKTSAKTEKLEHSQENKQEREKSVEKTREKLEKSLDKQEKTREKQPKPVEAREPQVITRAVRDAAFGETMKTVRSQLSPVQRSFSKLIHAKPVEITSELLEETVFRPSFLWGGVIGGIIFGAGLYLFARTQGFLLSGSEYIVGLFVGGIIGVIIEKVFRRKKSTKKARS
jgi:hypothetical protein